MALRFFKNQEKKNFFLKKCKRMVILLLIYYFLKCLYCHSINERNTAVSKDQLSILIEKKRAELIEMVTIEGLHSPNTILYSQELDRLLNQYNENYVVKRTSSSLVTNKSS